MLSKTEIRHIFNTSKNFNELFDAFDAAVHQRIDDVELYRILFWNDSLGQDELVLFGEKLAREFRHIAYDVYMWLANVFEVIFGKKDNYEMAFTYYQKAAAIKPDEVDPYLDACDCYNPDLDLPPAKNLIEFLKIGYEFVPNRKNICLRLAVLHQTIGENDLAEYYRVRADEAGESPVR
ncbi:MAG: hypothetical protein F9K22_10740 [Bacteroidetes bacterium]|nr:MAG: hypothetical protein F9K22_10740 [Bacteroidota bacterium]